MAQYLVGLDGGTTGCKTCIFDLDGKLVGSDYREYPSYYPEPGWVEQTTEDLLPNFYDSIKTAINKSGINPEDIIGFGFSSQGSVIGMLDENGELLRPWVGWQDLRGEGEGIEYLTSRIPRSEIYKQTGDPVGTTFSNAKLAWLKLHEPENWEKTALFPTMKSQGAAKNEANNAAQETKPVEKIDFSKVKVEPLFEEMVDFDTFSKSDFRAVKVKACEAVKKSKKLLQFTLDDGTGTDRTILSGIHAYYEPEELVGKTLIAITNLPPRAMMGIDSCGMLLSAIHEEEGEEKLHLLMVDDHIPAGAKLY